MADVGEIIAFIKALKKGFDKDLFQNKIDELGYAVDTVGLNYHDFHTLFKLWLNLSIPIQKWLSLGTCLVPPDAVEERTVEYAFRWLLANVNDQANVQRVAFLLDWLTAAMESESIDLVALDAGYEIFYIMLSYEVLTVHAIKLVYTLTKPVDVDRLRVLKIIDYSKKREAKKRLYRQLQVLLGLFKSYKPHCVPEDIPAVSIHTVFKKINQTLQTRFKRNQERRNKISTDKQHLMWVNPINSESGINKRADHLVPNLYYKISAFEKKIESLNRSVIKSCIEFTDPALLFHNYIHCTMERPARLRSLLCSLVGITLLSLGAHSQHDLVAWDLYKILCGSFLESSPYTYKEKRDLLEKISQLQRNVSQGILLITRFLAQYLPFWNEKDYFAELLSLVEWLSPNCPDYVRSILDTLTKVYHRSEPIEQCAILRCFTNLYTNLVYASTKRRHHFQNTPPSPSCYFAVLNEISGRISVMCSKQLQVNPDDTRVLYMSMWSSERRAVAELRHGVGIGALPSALTLALPLLTVSPGIKDSLAGLMILYKKIITVHKNAEQMNTLILYTSDFINCLYSEETLSGRQDGLIFNKIHPQLVEKLTSLLPDIDAKFSIRNHIAFAPYTSLYSTSIDRSIADNKMWINTVVDQEYGNLSKFLKKALPELR